MGLGGSIGHVLGNSGASYAHSHSATPFLLEFLYKELEINHPNPDLFAARLYGRETGRGDFTPIEAVALATPQMQGAPQNVEFLAKRLVQGAIETLGPQLAGRMALLATPLYVALAD